MLRTSTMKFLCIRLYYKYKKLKYVSSIVPHRQLTFIAGDQPEEIFYIAAAARDRSGRRERLRRSRGGSYTAGSYTGDAVSLDRSRVRLVAPGFPRRRRAGRGVQSAEFNRLQIDHQVRQLLRYLAALLLRFVVHRRVRFKATLRHLAAAQVSLVARDRVIYKIARRRLISHCIVMYRFGKFLITAITIFFSSAIAPGIYLFTARSQ